MANAAAKLFKNGSDNFILELNPTFKYEITAQGVASPTNEDTSTLSEVDFDISFQSAVDNAITLASACQVSVPELRLVRVIADEMAFDFEGPNSQAKQAVTELKEEAE